MLINLKEILDIAEARKIAVGSFNTPNLEAIRAVVEAAEELELPVIIQFAQCHESWISLRTIGPIMVDAAKKSSVPVCVHLDHGETLDYLQEALDLGFTSIMYDGSALSYQENLENTKKAVVMASKTDASVEAELGSMGRRESGIGEGLEMDDDTKIYTDPKQASGFVKQTEVTALACSFGTTHGIYFKRPNLDFGVVKNVRVLTDGIPVVMHGGSGVSRLDYYKAIESGVRKINYFTYLDKAGGISIVDYLQAVNVDEPVFFSTMLEVGRKAMKENAKNAMRMFAMIDQEEK
ncbi:MAG: ketose-bisphosphate aldolase [Bacteroidales bacterium]|jgi:fructose-bisphosphate aldolase class II